MRKADIAPEIIDAAVRACEHDDYTGICVLCGAEVEGCEPDGTCRPCPECGRYSVYGAEEIVIRCAS